MDFADYSTQGAGSEGVHLDQPPRVDVVQDAQAFRDRLTLPLMAPSPSVPTLFYRAIWNGFPISIPVNRTSLTSGSRGFYVDDNGQPHAVFIEGLAES